MSYDLAVFDPRQDLRDRSTFEDWYDQRTEWEDELNYNEPKNASTALQGWFHDIRQLFGPLNGPFAADDAGEKADKRVADYSISTDIIYVAFSWGDAELAYTTVLELAEKHKVGFLDASGVEGASWFPGPRGKLEVVHKLSEGTE